MARQSTIRSKSQAASKARLKARQTTALQIPDVRHNSWVCPWCSRWCSARRNGPANHLKYCSREQPATQPPQNAAPQALEPIMVDHSDSNSDTSSDTETTDTETEPDDSESSDSDTPLSKVRKARVARARARPLMQAVEMSDPAGNTEDTDSDSDSDNSDPNQRPRSLRPDQVWVEYHPASGKRSEILGIDNPDAGPSMPPPPPTTTTLAPWHPFRSREDFEQAEIFVRFDASNPQMNTQLRLNHRSGSRISLRNAQEVHDTLAKVPLASAMPNGFSAIDITVPFKGKEKREYTVRFRDSKSHLQDLLEDPMLADRICLYPERRYVRRQGGGVMRMWEECSSGDDWWNVQTKIGVGKFVIYCQLYVDATHVTAFGNVKYWAVYLWICNIPKADRNDSGGRGRGWLIGFIPLVPGKKGDAKGRLARHRADVYQVSFGTMLDILKGAAVHGMLVRIRTIIYDGIPAFISISADYEEMVRLAGTLGANSENKCTDCLIPSSEIIVYGQQHPQRTKEGTDQLFKRAEKASTIKERDTILRSQSLRFIQNTFLMFFSTFFCIYQAFIADPLHLIEQGEFGKHWWPWLLEYLPESSWSAIDDCIAQCPRFPGLHHFNNGVTGLKYLTGRELGQILRFLCPFLEGLLNEEDEEVIFGALRSLGLIHLYSKSFTVHTEETLDDLQLNVTIYGRWCIQFHDLDLGMNFNWPKHHNIDKIVGIIKRKGPTDNYETGAGERLHPQLKKYYERSSGCPGLADKQMLTFTQERDSILRIRALVDEYDNKCIAVEDAGEGVTTSSGRVKLCGPQKPTSLVAFATAIVGEIPEAGNFINQLVRFAKDNGLHDLSSSQRIKTCGVQRFSSATIKYVCLMSAALKKDCPRASPLWMNNGCRYDYSVVNGVAGLQFVQILAFLEIKSSTVTTHTLAMVRQFAYAGRHRYSDYIQLNGDNFVTNFIFVDTIVRAVVISPSSTYNPYYTVQDLESPDIYLRLKELM